MKRILKIALCMILLCSYGCKRNNDIVITQAFQNLLYLGLYVAEDAGFFADEGLTVRIETAGGDSQAFAALTSGKCDFAQGDPSLGGTGDRHLSRA